MGVVDLKTKETKTLQLKGLQPPASNQTAASSEAAPNSEEIVLDAQRIKVGDNSILINVDLPAGYHLNPTAPQRYKVLTDPAAKNLAIDQSNSAGSTRGGQPPNRIPLNANPGTNQVHASFTFFYCRQEHTRV